MFGRYNLNVIPFDNSIHLRKNIKRNFPSPTHSLIHTHTHYLHNEHFEMATNISLMHHANASGLSTKKHSKYGNRFFFRKRNATRILEIQWENRNHHSFIVDKNVYPRDIDLNPYELMS